MNYNLTQNVKYKGVELILKNFADIGDSVKVIGRLCRVKSYIST